MCYQLGSLKFTKPAETPISEDYGREHTYAEMKPAVGKSTIQDKGTNLVDANLSMYFHIDFCSPSDYIQKLMQMEAESQVVPYFWENGEFKGNFGIKSIRVRSEKRLPGGLLMAATVSVQLIEYSEAQFLKIVSAQYAEPDVVDPNQFTDPAPLAATGDGNFQSLSMEDITRRP